jgi:hypothetical protein
MILGQPLATKNQALPLAEPDLQNQSSRARGVSGRRTATTE